MRIEKLTLDSVPAAMQLSKQAGWNQCRADWELLLTLAPDHCFAGWIGDDLIATTTVVTYGGDVSWIGMVLVSEEHRGQGYGSQIFQTALEATLERGQSAIGLDATPSVGASTAKTTSSKSLQSRGGVGLCSRGPQLTT
ncbi:GNAT family N-acetyltransferase [Halocatena marina]|uniref:GNAT family N-acetyltransferase n=1 Tax=Halocatena marina TaxID=2934937 RepID=A0ABD5YK88_9EURY